MVKGDIDKFYGNRLRLRACGWLENGDSVLLIDHNLGTRGSLWIPPGGEVQYGESIHDALVREFHEETGLEVEVGEDMFVYEFISPPFHAVEVFCRISSWKGELITGSDPETDQQIIKETRFVTFEEIELMERENLHGIFRKVKHPRDITSLSGLYGYFEGEKKG